MTWDITKPVDNDTSGADQIKYGAQALRDFRADMETALKTEGIFPGSDTANPVYVHAFKSGNTAARPAAGNTGRWFFNSETKTIQRDNGSGWDDLTVPYDIIPAGKKMVFYNAAAPTGWTQDVTNTDRALRATTSVGGGAGGTDSVQTPPTHDHGAATGNPTAGLNHTHAVSGGGDGVPLTPASVNPSVFAIDMGSPVVSTTGDSGTLNHTHTISADYAFRPKYCDVIICYR